MRTWLLAALLVLVTLQSAWAAAGRSNLHASGPAAVHLGHQMHTHPHLHAAADDSPAADPVLPCFPGDADCEACHGSCAVVPVLRPLATSAPATARPATLALPLPASAPRETPERPQWA